MDLKPNFTRKDIQEECQRITKVFDEVLVRRLSYLGEQCVIRARFGGKYKNQTANLRNSIGYVIYLHGVKVLADFKHTSVGQVKSDINPTEKGEQYADLRAAAIASAENVVLVVVAGMDYASHVENMGLDVLTSTEQFADMELQGIMREVENNIQKLQTA
jgi:hypothetical protein